MLVKFRQAGNGEEKPWRKKTQEEKKIVFLSVDKAGDWYNNYVQIRERRGRRDWLCFRFSIEAGVEDVVPTIGGVVGG